MDEFDQRMRVTELNKWLDGQQIQIRRKGLPPLMKTKNTPILTLTNTKIDDMYPAVKNSNIVQWEAWRGRYTYVELGEGDKIDLKLKVPPEIDDPEFPPAGEDDKADIDELYQQPPTPIGLARADAMMDSFEIKEAHYLDDPMQESEDDPVDEDSQAEDDDEEESDEKSSTEEFIAIMNKPENNSKLNRLHELYKEQMQKNARKRKARAIESESDEEPKEKNQMQKK